VLPGYGRYDTYLQPDEIDQLETGTEKAMNELGRVAWERWHREKILDQYVDILPSLKWCYFGQLPMKVAIEEKAGINRSPISRETICWSTLEADVGNTMLFCREDIHAFCLNILEGIVGTYIEKTDDREFKGFSLLTFKAKFYEHAYRNGEEERANRLYSWLSATSDRICRYPVYVPVLKLNVMAEQVRTALSTSARLMCPFFLID